MSAKNAAKRRIALLKKIADIAQYRTDEVVIGYMLGNEFMIVRELGIVFIRPFDDSGDPICDDLSVLASEGLITPIPGSGEHKGFVQLTTSGLKHVHELERSWWSKAIDKQPITFVQVVITVVTLVLTGANIAWTWELKHEQDALAANQKTMQAAGYNGADDQADGTQKDYVPGQVMKP